MLWQQSGPRGEQFAAQISSEPGWYWVYRPRTLGPGRYAQGKGMLLLVHAGADGRIVSPLADLRGPGDLVCTDARSEARLQGWFAGPVSPGEQEGFLALDGRRKGAIPSQGWHWCRTETPLQLVDEHGIGPVFIDEGRDGRPWVWLATNREGKPVDVGELGFAEPLSTERGIIDGAGEVGRSEAAFHGRISVPMGVPAAFPTD